MKNLSPLSVLIGFQFRSLFNAEEINRRFKLYVGKLPEIYHEALRYNFEQAHSNFGSFLIEVPKTRGNNWQLDLFGKFLATVILPGTRAVIECRADDRSMFGIAVSSGRTYRLKYGPMVQMENELVPVPTFRNVEKEVDRRRTISDDRIVRHVA